MEKWYIARHDEEELYSSIIEIKAEKSVKKVSKELESQP